MKTLRFSLAALLISLFLYLSPSSAHATLIVEQITGAPPGQLPAEGAFLNILNDGAGIGVGYGLIPDPVLANVWTVQRTLLPGATQSTFDVVLNQVLMNPNNLVAEVGYGSQGGALYAGVLVDAFLDGAGTPSTGTQRFDMEDILLFPQVSPNLSIQTALLLHGLYELHHSVAGNTEYRPAHTAALAHENDMSASVGGPERFDPPRRKVVGPNVALGLPTANDWLIDIVVDPFGPRPLGIMRLRGSGDGGNVAVVANGPFSFPSSTSLPATQYGDIRLESVTFVPEPGTLGLLVLGMAGLSVVRLTSRR